MTIHSEAFEGARQTFPLAGGEFVAEDWADRVLGVSWMAADRNLAALGYAMRVADQGLPLDDEVVYGKADGQALLLHVSELGGERAVHEAADAPPPLPSDEDVADFLAEVTGPHVQISEDLERLEARKRIDGRFHVPSVTEWIRIGDIVLVKDAAGEVLRKRATSPDLEDDGREVVWLCDEDEWQAARERGREPEATRWPIGDVVQAERPEPVEQEEVRDGDA